ncbi:YopX family protein [Clostridium sp.]|uniref:YopX family protein n=1 Tax=Clostridium sp. TaxID=1506 RepID=UPI00284FA32C|nr:YopX family protein [Clostridium sp.]MDR3598423.1 YopX family protein [Clostridium sp.]
MKAKDFTLKVVNEIDKDKFELIDFKPYMTYASSIDCILGDAEILRPIGITDVEGDMIYENYIIEVEEMIGDKRKYKCIVQYNDSKARFEAKEIRKDMKYIHVFEILNSLCVLKIIGNVYQNKGLLN